MDIFPLAKLALDDAFALIPGRDDAAKYAAIKKELDRLNGVYARLKQYQNVDYSDPVTRFAYVYRYVTSHAHLVCDRIAQSKSLRALFKESRVQMSAIGGGPGSDLLGVLGYLEPKGAKLKLSCHIFDRETAWGDTWSDLAENIDCDVRLFSSFMAFDVTKPETWTKLGKYLESDFVSMIYFMSEVYGLREKAEEFFATLMGDIKPGALFLFVDNNSSEFYDWFDSLAGKHGLEILASGSGMETIPMSEEKAELGKHFTELGQAFPKIKANVAWRVAQKKP